MHNLAELSFSVILAVFTRLLDHTLDPPLLVALSRAGFVISFLVWESLSDFESDASDRRGCFFIYSTLVN